MTKNYLSSLKFKSTTLFVEPSRKVLRFENQTESKDETRKTETEEQKLNIVFFQRIRFSI
jgi:hypothetical protein